MKWREFANAIISEYDTIAYIDSDEDDNCIYCPECGEPIYECDYPEIETDKDRNLICPICECIFDWKGENNYDGLYCYYWNDNDKG